MILVHFFLHTELLIFLTITWQNKIFEKYNIDLLFIQNVLNIVYLLINFLQNICLFLSMVSEYKQIFFFPVRIHKKEMASIKQDILLFSFSQKIQLHVFCLHSAMNSFII